MINRLLIYGLLLVIFTLGLGKTSFGFSFIFSNTGNYNTCESASKVPLSSHFHSNETWLGNIEDDSIPKYMLPIDSQIKLNGQQTPPKLIISNQLDSIEKPDNLNSFKEKANNNFITRNLYSWLVDDGQISKNKLGVNSALYFKPYADKKIASIRIKQLDVFGPTLQDTTLVAKEWPSKVANSLHLKTVERKLRKQLLFSTGQKVQPELMAENEKIIRELPYIRDVSIILTPSASFKDQVDVLILTKERFEYGFEAKIDPPVSYMQLYDDNMFGLGHQFSAKLVYHQIENPKVGCEFVYSIGDIGGKFINGTFGLLNTYRETGWNIALEKKFVSTDVRNAGGVSIQRIYRDMYLTPYNLTELDTAVSYINTDYWFGHALSIHNKSSYLGNAIISGRYYRQYYYSSFGISPNSMIRNHDFILSTLGFSKRDLYKSDLIYGYGITEDVPYGRYFEISSGIDFTSFGNRPYSHILYSKANVFKGGSYFNWLIGIGGFLQYSKLEQGAFHVNLNYFAHMVYINGNPYRNFINIDLLSGINRFADEYLSINRNFGIRDFKSLEVKGTNRLKIIMESVHFLKWNYHGFRFAQYFFSDCAFLSNSLNRIFREDFYTGIGAGLRVNNESLVFKVFELRFTWFPIVPPDQNIIYFNAFTQSKAQFDDFLGRKPEEILYK